jgi:hypothetical protein
VPAEEEIAGRLHQALSLDHTLAVRREAGGAEVGLEHRGLSLLDLHEQGIASVAADHQRDPAARADARDSDHLVGNVDDLVGVEKLPPVGLERASEPLEDRAHEPLDRLRVGDPAENLLDRDDQRWVRADPRAAVDRGRELL